MGTETGVFYAHLIDKPVEATAERDEPVRGILRVEDRGPLVWSFDCLAGCWRHWDKLAELDFGELANDELRDWQYNDPRGHLLAGFRWAASQGSDRDAQ